MLCVPVCIRVCLLSNTDLLTYLMLFLLYEYFHEVDPWDGPHYLGQRHIHQEGGTTILLKSSFVLSLPGLIFLCIASVFMQD